MFSIVSRGWGINYCWSHRLGSTVSIPEGWYKWQWRPSFMLLGTSNYPMTVMQGLLYAKYPFISRNWCGWYTASQPSTSSIFCTVKPLSQLNVVSHPRTRDLRFPRSTRTRPGVSNWWAPRLVHWTMRTDADSDTNVALSIWQFSCKISGGSTQSISLQSQLTDDSGCH